MSPFISFFFSLACTALCMAWFTLLERKSLGYFQLRKGPNKSFLFGIAQPLMDVMKLLTKEVVLPLASNLSMLYCMPIFGLMLAFICMGFLPSFFPTVISSFSVFVLVGISSVSILPILLSGWSSNSKYALLGSVRGVAQSISYEVSMSVILLSIMNFLESLNLCEVVSGKAFCLAFWFPVSLCWLISCLAETGRAPLDFMEGESEIVSGFNIEYSGNLFSLLFMAEYVNIILICGVTSAMLLGLSSVLMLSLSVVLLIFIFIWARGSLPRVRYDNLMGMTWKCFLPVSLIFYPLSMSLLNV